MADCSLPPPPPFLALPGEPPVLWSRWLHSFETYLVAAGLDEVSTVRKKALLQHCLGAEGQRVLGTNNADNDATYDKAVTLLNEHFATPQSVLLRRFIFRRHHQLPVERDARTPQAVGTGPDFTLPQGPIFPSQPPFSHLLSSPGPATPCLVPSSPRPVRARSRPGHLKDFVATFHV
ncbi:hypothetical protein G5714_013115 [Onychostoma macrolepis]|uniref:Uncharacterized protein n=1 Tax=Onychostoma macrolepis TaxID=369639 RepID=A0A7J6CFP9_9TELE|nr:hypothetical protein G5714_013115 [Onychostoma macrolepis]